MIFVTVGMMYGFNRLIQAADNIAEKIEDEVIMQIGESTYEPINAKYFRYESQDRISEHYKSARIVVCHAGVGSILNALKNGKPIVLVPRRKKFGETIDDHQLEISGELGGSKEISVVIDINMLEDTIKKFNNRPLITGNKDNKLVNALQTYLQNHANKLAGEY